MTYRSSFSQHNLFSKCKRLWFYQYVKRIPVISDMSYAEAGDTLHKTLQRYYNEKTIPIEDLKQVFTKLWESHKLHLGKLSLRKDSYWLMVLQGIKLDVPMTTTEMKIFFPEAVSYLDIVDTNEDIIIDWKSSTRSKENEEEYIKQLKFYSYMYYRKFNRIPKKVIVYYLKYTGSKNKLEHNPTMQDILDTEDWYNKILAQMIDIRKRPIIPPKCETCYHFCAFQNLCMDKDGCLKYEVKVSGSNLYLNGPITNILNMVLNKKFSYELKNSFFIKQHNPNINTVINFWNYNKRSLPIGFKQGLLKTLKDYGDYLRKKDKNVVVDVKDERVFNDEKVVMPEKFLNDVVLRDYQREAADTFLHRKIGILEIGTGGGKTEIAIECVRRVGVKTLFIVDKVELLRQTKERMENALGIEIGQIGQGVEDIKSVTIATVQTLTKHLKKYAEYFSSIRFVIFDETHKVAAKSYWKLSQYLPNTEYRMGISGTAFRDDGNDMMINATTGYKVYDLSSRTLIEKGWLTEPGIIFIKGYMSKEEIKQLEEESLSGLINETLNYNSYYNKFITTNNKRNNVIKQLANKHSNKKVLILTRLIEHGDTLKNMIEGSKHLYGETDKKIRKEMLDEFVNGNLNVLISTISIFSEGIDIPKLEVIINGGANKGDVKTIQMLGRVLRKKKGKENALYYDFLDEGKFFKGASFKRRKAG